MEPKAPHSTHKTSVSRRRLLKSGAAALGGGAATLLGGGAAPAGQAVTAPARQTSSIAGRKFRAFVKMGNRAAVQELTLRPLGPHQVLVRNQATQCCYTMVGEVLGDGLQNPAKVLGHAGVGIVEAVGLGVRRVQVGDRVVVANTPQCGECYNCLHGRSDMCEAKLLPLVPVADMQDGTPVTQHQNYGGLAELMVPYEDFCVPVFTNLSSVELAMLGCVGGAGLSAVTTFVPVEPGSDVVILGAGPIGLSAIQGARIMGAAQIIAVEPIRYRRDLALKMGATMVLDPNVEGDKLVARIRELCKGQTNRIYAGGRDYTNPDNRQAGHLGPDFVIEAVGGDRFPPKAEAGPDPTGILSLRQAWEITRGGGHFVTIGVGQRGDVSFPAGTWANQGRTHHAGQLGGGANTKRDLPRFVKLVEKGLFDAKSLATATYPLQQTREAFQAVSDRTTVAAVIVFA